MTGMTGDAPAAGPAPAASTAAGTAVGTAAGAGRPVLGDGGVAVEDAAVAVAGLVAELQQGLDDRDAGVYNRHFAADVLWGSPFGMTVEGYEPLHAIHERLNAEQRGGTASRYEVATILSPAPDVIVTQVRRVALGPDGEPEPARAPGADPARPFSEMAMYVLVRRDGQWWLAAGQNTLIQPVPFTTGQAASPRPG
jgi:uncharacterized protein (TIGR02246 family)